jgi:hypothetical protein
LMMIIQMVKLYTMKLVIIILGKMGMRIKWKSLSCL